MRLAIIATACLSLTTPAALGQTVAPTDMVASKPGFSFPDSGPIRIILFKPDVDVSELTTGGMEAPNADWTASGRRNLLVALTKAEASGQNEIKLMPDLAGDDNRLMVDYRLLLRAVVRSAFAHRLASEDRLPTKSRGFDWTLGAGAQRLADIGGGEYGLFLFSEDSFSAAGSKAAQMVGNLFGVARQAEQHMGYAGLVDLRTGDLVWLNVDPKMRGDIRTAEGADVRIAELLEKFPKRGVEAKPEGAQ